MSRSFVLVVFAAVICGCGKPATEKSDGPSPAEDSPPAGPVSDVSPASAESQSALAPVSGPARAGKYVELVVTEAGFDAAGPAAPPGLRNYTVGLRGIGRARGNDFALQIEPFVFAQNERGCMSRPEPNATWLKQPFGSIAVFSRTQPTTGQLAFLVPEDTKRVRILIAPAAEGGLVVPVGEDFEPSWSAPIRTIEDGSTLRVLVLPLPAQVPAPASAAAGKEQVVLDFVIENLSSDQGIEFTTSQQLRLVDATGAFVQPSAATKQIGCRLDDGDVIPPGHSRRFQVAYDMLAGAPRRLQYRGFEVDEVTVDLP